MRRLANLTSGLSLLLLGVTVVLWIQSYRAAGFYEFPRLLHHSRGVLYVTRDLGWDWQVLDDRPRGALGFSLYRGLENIAEPRGGVGTIAVWTLGVPYWAIASLLAAAPATHLAIRMRRRCPSGRCPVCGYDLRATPHRCPECGAEAVDQLGKTL